MQLINNLTGQRNSGPGMVGPTKCSGIDHFGRFMHAIGLKARSRVGVMLIIVSKTECVSCPGPDVGEQDRKIPVTFCFQPKRTRALSLIEDRYIDSAMERSPYTERGPCSRGGGAYDRSSMACKRLRHGCFTGQIGTLIANFMPG